MDKKKPLFSRQQGYVSTIGLTLVFSIFIGTGMGLFFDKVFNTKPLMMFIFMILGIISGFYNIFRVTKSLYGNKKSHL